MENVAYPEFKCSNCTAIMVAVRRNLSDSSPIVCSRCGTFLGTFSKLQQSRVDRKTAEVGYFDRD
jgi:DNA-directed RNA polymerase subunit RPC12/RpoP